jgi:hypothetical protein
MFCVNVILIVYLAVSRILLWFYFEFRKEHEMHFVICKQMIAYLLCNGTSGIVFLFRKWHSNTSIIKLTYSCPIGLRYYGYALCLIFTSVTDRPVGTNITPNRPFHICCIFYCPAIDRATSDFTFIKHSVPRAVPLLSVYSGMVYKIPEM